MRSSWSWTLPKRRVFGIFTVGHCLWAAFLIHSFVASNRAWATEIENTLPITQKQQCPWQRNRLGIRPYRFVGMWSLRNGWRCVPETIKTCELAFTKPRGVCNRFANRLHRVARKLVTTVVAAPKTPSVLFCTMQNSWFAGTTTVAVPDWGAEPKSLTSITQRYRRVHNQTDLARRRHLRWYTTS